jgi:hypothetical protein
MYRDVYSGYSRLKGEEDENTLRAAINYSSSLVDLRRFKEAKSLLRKMMPVARRVLGENHNLTLRMRWIYAQTLYKADGATLDDLREAVATLVETVRTARRVFGGAHPLTTGIEGELGNAQAELRGKLLSFDVSLRFAVGARVECARGGDTWAPGRVIKLHYHEAGFEPWFFAPYQIELDDGGLIYAPDDDDNCIREAT